MIKRVETEISNPTQNCWYLDDVIISGIETELNEASDISTVSPKTWGLEIIRDKCEVMSKRALHTVETKNQKKT